MGKYNIWVLGSGGQLGQCLRKYADIDSSLHFIFKDRRSFDLRHALQYANYQEDEIPAAIINCAAYAQVDKAEEEPALAREVNALALEPLTAFCKKSNILLIHYSSDYVYHNPLNRPLREDDPTSPQSIYGSTKLEGERIIGKSGCRHIIIRTSWLYSEFRNNFVKTMIALSEKRNLEVVSDQIGAPTYAGDLADISLKLLRMKLKKSNVVADGVYNYSNLGVCSWYDFALAIFELIGKHPSVKPVDTNAFPRPAKRPNYSVLDLTKISEILPNSNRYWKTALAECLDIMDVRKF